MAFHLWTISEVYSNADGTVQFIELFTTSSGETLIAGHTISFTPTAGSPVNYVVPNNLGSSTANKSLLFATQGFADLGIVAPDFIIPSGFLSVGGGTLDVFGVDSLSFASLPTDGTSSLNGSGVAGANSPTNFSGASGTIQSGVISGDDGPNNLAGTVNDDVISGGGGHDTLTGGAGNDTLDGGPGADTAVYGGNRASFTVVGTPGGFSVSGPEGTDMLVGIERFDFLDEDIAIDLGPGQAAGNTVRIIGAAFDAPSIAAQPDWVGIGLDLFDSGLSMLAVCELVAPILGLGNTEFVSAVYENVVGVPPSQGELDLYLGLLQGSGGTMTQGQLLELAANSPVNEANINLTGLQTTGVEFA